MRSRTVPRLGHGLYRSATGVGLGAFALMAATAGARAQQAPGTISNEAGSISQLKVATPAPATATIGGTAPIPAYKPLTYEGVTLYGTFDVGFGYMSHGEPLSQSFGPGLNYLVSKDSGASRWGVAPNALSYSGFGLRGKELLGADTSLVFDGSTTYVPTSGHLSNGLNSLSGNNGVAPANQSANADSSRDGQIFNTVAFLGLSNPTFGTLTFGRQNTLTVDGVVAYDPLFASNAFSLIGWQGATAGGGDTEDARLDSSFKYLVNVGPVRAGVLYQLDNAPGKAYKYGTGGGGAVQVDIGTTFRKLDLDAIYSQVNDAIAAGTLSATQVRREPTNSIAATVSDNQAVMLLGKYHFQRAVIFAGYENIRFANPSDPVRAGAYDFGYQLSVVNNDAYLLNRLLQVAWTGFRIAVTKRLSIDSGFYYEHQNSYAADRCRTAFQASCSGAFDVVSILADYRLLRHFDVYGGAMLSMVNNGLSSGFQNKSNVDPTVGGRLTF